MDIFQRTGIYHKMKTDGHGIQAMQMADFSSTVPEWELYGGKRPVYKNAFEEILIGRYGTSAGVCDAYIPGTWETKKQMCIGKYHSGTISRLIKESKMPITESEIISKVDQVAYECDLRQTSATALPNLKKVGGTLTLDTASPLQSLSGLRKAGKINVVAKNVQEMDNYLKKLGLLSSDGKKILVDVADDIYLIMKNYL